MNFSADTNECESSPCLHDGTCIDHINGYECQCLAEWMGPQCQLDADECQGSPCLNADGCRNIVGDYICDCLPGWTGKNCDISEYKLFYILKVVCNMIAARCPWSIITIYHWFFQLIR